MLFVSKHYDLLFLKMIYSENFDEEYKTNRGVAKTSICAATTLIKKAKFFVGVGF